MTSTDKKQIHRASANPERLNSIVKIVPPPTLLFTSLSVASVAGLLLWTVFGNLPRAVTIPGIFIPPDSLSEVQSDSDGFIFFREDLKQDTEALLDQYAQELSNLQRQGRANSGSLDPTGERHLLDFIKYYSDLSASVQTRPESLLNLNPTLEASINSPISESRIQAGVPFAFIFDPSTSINLSEAAQAYTSSNKVLKNQLRLASRTALSARQILEQLKGQYLELKKLASIGVVAETDVLSAKQKLLSAQQSQDDGQINLQKTRMQEQKNFVSLVSGVALNAQSVFLTKPEDGYLLTKIIRSGNRVSKGQPVAFTSKLSSTKNLDTITAFVPPKAAQGLKVGMKTLVSPVNVDRQKYGSITGQIASLSTISVASKSATGIIGIEAIASEAFSKQASMFLTTIKLDKKTTASGYKWNTSDGPPYRVAISTPASIQVIAENIKPISLLLPWINSVTGFQ